MADADSSGKRIRSGPEPSLPAPLPSPAPPTTTPTTTTLDPSSTTTTDSSSSTAAAYEAQHVHTIYSAIAPHFSHTRHRPWPAVSSFLATLPPGAVGIDVGCGNGKYLGLNPSVHILACDRSVELVGIAATRRGISRSARHRDEVSNSGDGKGEGGGGEGGDDLLLADSLSLPFPPSRADFAISIAVVHHLSTRSRRRDAVAALLGCVRPGCGRVLVYVWALEQGGSRRGWEAGGMQDLLVPWVVTGAQRRRVGREGGNRTGKERDEKVGEKGDDGDDARETFHRYYHLYKQGELEEDVGAVGGIVVESGYERDNWWVVCRRGD